MTEQNNKNNNNSQKKQTEIRVANDKKGWITEKCGTNTPPANPPKNPSTGNKKK